MLYHVELQIKCQILIFKVAKLYSNIQNLELAYTLIIKLNLGLAVTIFFNSTEKHFSKEVSFSLTSAFITSIKKGMVGDLLVISQKTSLRQFSSQSCPTLCDPMNLSTPGLPVHHQLPEFTQTHVHRVGDAIQPSHHLLSPSPPAPNPSQHQSLFQ